MNIIELQKVIQTFLSTKTTRVYFRQVPENAAYPYIVYNLPDSNEEINREDFQLEVDFWDDNNVTSVIDTLVGDVDGDGDVFNPTGLHRKNVYSSGVLSAKFYRTNRMMIEDEDPRIEHRQLRYSVQTYLT